jgi:hypothetical protein
VPDKNLKHMEDFHISEEHECYGTYEKHSDCLKRFNSRDINKSEFLKLEYDNNHANNISMTRRINFKCPLEIAAPVKDFNMSDMIIQDYQVVEKIEVPDPIVLKPVILKNKKH